MNSLEAALKEIKTLSEAQLKEVADFIAYVKGGKKSDGYHDFECDNEFPFWEGERKRFDMG